MRNRTRWLQIVEKGGRVPTPGKVRASFCPRTRTITLVPWAVALALVALLAGPRSLGAAGERVLFSNDFASGLGGMTTQSLCGPTTTWHNDTACAGPLDPPPSAPGYARWGVAGNCTDYASGTARTRLRKNLVFLDECVWDLEVSFDYLLDFMEDSNFDRARVWVAVDVLSSAFFSNGNPSGQVASCAGGINPSDIVLPLVGDGSWHRVSRRLVSQPQLDFIGILAYDFFDLVFEAETADGTNNWGRGLLVDDVTVTCTPRPPGTTALRASFDSDAPGSPPGPIETGTLNVLPVAWPIEVVDFAGDRQLSVFDGSLDANPSLRFEPSSEPVEALVEYVYAVPLIDNTHDTYSHGPDTWPGPNGPKLIWRENGPQGQVWLSTDNSSTADDIQLPGFAWFTGQRAKIVWLLSGSRDRFSVWINDLPAALDVPFPHQRIDSVRFFGMAGGTQFGSFVVDDVRVTDYAPIFSDGFESGNTSAWSNG